LHEDEESRDDENGRAENPEQQLGEADALGLAAELLRQEPIDRAHEAHQQPDDERVDMQDLRDVEMEQTEQQIGLDVVDGREHARQGHHTEKPDRRHEIFDGQPLRTRHARSS